MDVPMRPALDADSAFEIYLRDAGRSYLKLADLTGVPLNTIRTWAVKGNWSDRAALLEEQARHANRRHILSALDAGMPEALTTIRQRMKSENERVSLDASSRWAELWGRYRDLVHGENAGADDDVDVSQLSDSDLFAEVKRQAQR